MIKTIIFDLNKVLVKTKDINEEYRVKLGVGQKDFWKPRKEFFKDYEIGKINLNQFLLRIMERNKIGKNKFLEAKKLYEKNTALVPGIKGLLNSLQKNYSLILAAGDGKEGLNMKLDKFRLKHYFKKIYATCYEGLFKTDVNFYKKILDKSCLIPKETLFIDDRESHLKPAMTLEIKTILFENSLKLKKDLKEEFSIFFW